MILPYLDKVLFSPNSGLLAPISVLHTLINSFRFYLKVSTISRGAFHAELFASGLVII